MRIFKKSDIIDFDSLDKALTDLTTVPPVNPGTEPTTVAGTAPEQNRTAILERLQQALTSGRHNLHQNHLAGASGHAIVQGHAYLMDVLIRHIYRLVHHNQPQPTFSLVAIGGYGRGELAPFSDIDLLFLLPEAVARTHRSGRGEMNVAGATERTPAGSARTPIHTAPNSVTHRIEQTLYYLWDLRLDVGHAVRTIDDCVQLARQNVEIRTAMLESRFLSGDDALFTTYYDTLFAKVLERGPEAFLRAKLLEQSKRHERFGNSMFYLEPNVKENPGGLRDLQTFFWISKYRYQVKKVRDLIPRNLITLEEYNTFIRCQSFLRRVRNALHYRAGRREDRLTFQHQIDIAAEFGYKDQRAMRGVEQFMRRYYKVSRQVGNLSWLFLRKYQEEHRRLRWWDRRPLEECFQLHGDKVTVSNPEVFVAQPVCLMKLFEVGQRHLKSIHPDAMHLVSRDLGLIDHQFRRNPVVAALFLKMLNGERAVAWVLRRMSMLGVLGRYIPEFGRIIGQSQHDLFHVYTVDEHTMLAIEALRHIKSGKFSAELPICTALMAQLDYYEKGSIILYLAVLLHDIAKGRGGDHQLKGALIARQVCLRLGLSDSEAGMVCWLVGRHLLFSRTAFRRDISDPKTVIQFTHQVGTQKRLEFLLLLTVADIRAVGPGVWNLWKADLLRRLYNLALATLKKGVFQPEELEQQAETKKLAVLRILATKLGNARTRHHLDRFEADYFLHYEAETIARHTLALIGKEEGVDEASVAIIFLTSPISDTTELLIHARDQSGLMARISGTLAMAGVNILSADITTTRDGMALDLFVVQNSMGKALEEGPALQRLEQNLRICLVEQVRPQQMVIGNAADIRRRSTFDVPLTIETEESWGDCTILEITSLDRVGLLFMITREIERHGIQIRTAKIATYGERAVDVFYVRDLYGLKLVPQRVASFTKGLRQVMLEWDQAEGQRSSADSLKS